MASPKINKLKLLAAIINVIRFEANITPKTIDKRDLIFPRVILVIAGLDKATLNEKIRNTDFALYN